MNFRTYVVNLKRDIDRFHQLKKSMKERNIDIERFDAIYGKEIDNFDPYQNYISSYCQYFCPRGLVGCGLSHFILLDMIYQNYQKTKDTEYTLILEDDVIPIFNNKKDIDDIIKNIPSSCDILLLYCQGLCGYDSKPIIPQIIYHSESENSQINHSEFFQIDHPTESEYSQMEYQQQNEQETSKYMIRNTPIINTLGSTAAYFVKNSSIPKFLENVLNFHVDLQWYSNHKIKVCIYRTPMFNVNKTSSYNNKVTKPDNIFLLYFDSLYPLDNMSIEELVNYKVFRIPLLDIEMTCLDIIITTFIIIIIILFILLIIILNKTKTNVIE